jgi:hypothetical protein
MSKDIETGLPLLVGAQIMPPWVWMLDVELQNLMSALLSFGFALVQLFLLSSALPFRNGDVYSRPLYLGSTKLSF